MRVAICATHAHPLPSKAHTGDSAVILDLCWSLNKLGHDVTLFAPDGTVCVAAEVVSIAPAHNGQNWEADALDLYRMRGNDFDIVHDWSIGKTIARHMAGTWAPFIATLLGGTAYKPMPNTVVWSHAMRDRIMRGATDFENTPTPEMGGDPCEPFKDVKVVYGGIDLEFYSPGNGELDIDYLWLSRWHPVRGYRRAIEWAKSNGANLVMCGEDPRYDHPYQADCAMEAMELAAGCSNIRFEFLPPDPDHHTAKRDMYRRARRFLLTPEFQEPFGFSPVEAQACGAIVHPMGISNEMGSIPELFGSMAPKRTFDRMQMAREYASLYGDVIRGEGWGA